jgi:hypothetical protein
MGLQFYGRWEQGVSTRVDILNCIKNCGFTEEGVGLGMEGLSKVERGRKGDRLCEFVQNYHILNCLFMFLMVYV